MPFCSNCGAEVQGNFCAKCGAPMAGPAGGTAPPPPPPVPTATGLTDNVAAALCYLLGLLTGILFLVLAPYSQNRTIRFHAPIDFSGASSLGSRFIASSPWRCFDSVCGSDPEHVLHLGTGLGFFVLADVDVHKAY
jgi:hypothetical protein